MVGLPSPGGRPVFSSSCVLKSGLSEVLLAGEDCWGWSAVHLLRIMRLASARQIVCLDNVLAAALPRHLGKILLFDVNMAKIRLNISKCGG